MVCMQALENEVLVFEWLLIIDREAGEIIHLVLSIRLSVNALTAEPFDPWPWFLAWGSTLTLARLGL